MEAAIRSTQHNVTVRWHPFQLRPGLPKEGEPKGGNPQSRVGDRIRVAGEAVGINFTGLCDRRPNTLMAHAAVKFVSDPEKQNQLQEVLFRQYFSDGTYPDSQAISDAANEVGLDASALVAHACAEDNQQAVAREAESNSRSGITGVPFFIINGKPAFSGAQPPSEFLRVFEAM